MIQTNPHPSPQKNPGYAHVNIRTTAENFKLIFTPKNIEFHILWKFSSNLYAFNPH